MSCAETRPTYILALRAQALDKVQELIQPNLGPWVDPPLPTQEQWAAIIEAAFPPPPMAAAGTGRMYDTVAQGRTTLWVRRNDL